MRGALLDFVHPTPIISDRNGPDAEAVWYPYTPEKAGILRKAIGAIWATIGSFLVSIFLLDLLFRETRANFRWMLKGISTFWMVRRAE